MTELQELQRQVEELKNTVEDLKAGTVKIVTLKDRLSQMQCKIFNKYFASKFDMSDEYWKRRDFAKPGYVIASEKRDQCRKSIADTAKAIYIMNHISEYNELSNIRFDKCLKNDEQIAEYLKLFENICKNAGSEVTNSKFRVESEGE